MALGRPLGAPLSFKALSPSFTNLVLSFALFPSASHCPYSSSGFLRDHSNIRGGISFVAHTLKTTSLLKMSLFCSCWGRPQGQCSASAEPHPALMKASESPTLFLFLLQLLALTGFCVYVSLLSVFSIVWKWQLLPCKVELLHSCRASVPQRTRVGLSLCRCFAVLNWAGLF